MKANAGVHQHLLSDGLKPEKVTDAKTELAQNPSYETANNIDISAAVVERSSDGVNDVETGKDSGVVANNGEDR